MEWYQKGLSKEAKDALDEFIKKEVTKILALKLERLESPDIRQLATKRTRGSLR